MPIQSPILDDLGFNRVVEELKRRIPVYAPEWTDFNDSDPGIAMIQLFAYLTEMIGYRLNRIPEKTYVELLKLLGVRLKPARAAATRLAFFLSNPVTALGGTIDARSRASAKKGTPPPLFETDAALDLVPCEPAALITTKNPALWDLTLTQLGTRDLVDSTNTPAKTPSNDNAWLTVAWDGMKPMLKDFPVAPVQPMPPSISGVEHPYLWIGLGFNPARDAGFLGATVTLTVQLDDDEKPDATREELCATPLAPGEQAPPPITWLAYYDAAAGAMVNVPGRILDTTSTEPGKPLTRSGTLRFTVPFTMGEIPLSQYQDLAPAFTPSRDVTCSGIGTAIKDNVPPPPAGGTPTIDIAKLQTALTAAVTAAQQTEAKAKPAVPHPLDPKLRDPAKLKGWLRIGPLSPPPSSRLRMLIFNAVGASNASTVENELLGASDGRPGQTYTLANRNVLLGSLELAIQESPDPLTPLISWTELATLDGASPFDRVFALDAEAGVITFGDGTRGRIPPLVPGGGQVVALRYRWGGGKSGEVPPGSVTVPAVQATGLMGVTNFVAATGGADAEQLDDAKVRARKELSTRSRAVTAGDFEWLALQTPSVRVARVQVVPLRRPLASPLLRSQRRLLEQRQAMVQALAAGQPCAPTAGTTGTVAAATRRRLAPGVVASIAQSTAPSCGPPLPVGPAGLDDDLEAPGAVSVVVVPDEDGPEPVPTPSFLRAVCEQLNRVRLVTTEVHVVPPQYCRLCQFTIRVKARPGYTRSQLQALVEARLATYLHVLTGGEDGTGYRFGAQVHVADLIAQVFRTEGVERVDALTARFARTKSNAAPRTGLLTLCPAAAGEYDHVDLGAEETASFDATSTALSTE